MEFYWMILLIVVPIFVIIPGGLIIIAFYKIKQKKNLKLKTKDSFTEKRLKGKDGDTGHVACSDCGKLCAPDQMSPFGYYKTTIFVGDNIPTKADTYEEIIPDKKPKHTYSFVKDLCPSCAARLRTIEKTYYQEMKIVGIVFLVFLLAILFKLWF